MLVGAVALLASWSAAQTPIDPDAHPGDAPGGATPTGTGGGSVGGQGDPQPGSQPGAQAPLVPGATTGPVVSPVPRPPNAPPFPLLDLGPDTATWEVWWNLNRDRFLGIKARVYAGDAGAAPSGTGLARRRPEARLVADRVMPALTSLLEHETDPVLVAETLIALARADLGRATDDATSARAIERLSAALSDKQLAVVESAVMALGARGSARSIPVLAALVEDSAAGRAALARAVVPTRVRSIAALALGLAAARGRVDVQRYAAHTLSRPLQARGELPQDLAAACATALGLVDLGAGAASDQDLPAASSASALARFLEGVADVAENDQLVRAQAAASVGRIAGRDVASGDDRARVAAIVWAVKALGDAARPAPVRQGLVIALARLGRPTDSAPDRAARTALVNAQRDTDRLVRGLAWLARAEIGARARDESERSAALEIQAGLLADFADARGGSAGYLAMALGLLAHDSALVAAIDGNRALKDAWPRARNPSDASAIGLALGLRFDITSAPLLSERFVREGDGPARAALALGLGLAGSTSVVNALRTASGVENHPLVIRDAAIARALLGDATATDEMLALLSTTRSLLAADYASDALSAMGDGSALDALVAMAKDASVPTARRARAVRALGAVADASLLPWNEPLRADGHIGAAFEAWNAVVNR
jgi:HEAT repeat protein